MILAKKYIFKCIVLVKINLERTTLQNFMLMSTTGIMIVNCTVIEFVEMIKFIMFYS